MDRVDIKTTENQLFPRKKPEKSCNIPVGKESPCICNVVSVFISTFPYQLTVFKVNPYQNGNQKNKSCCQGCILFLRKANPTAAQNEPTYMGCLTYE